MTRLRILSDTLIEGRRLAPDTLIDVPAELAAQLVAAGHADDHPDAVAHCQEQGAKAIAVAGFTAAVDPAKPPKTPRRKAKE